MSFVKKYEAPYIITTLHLVMQMGSDFGAKGDWTHYSDLVAVV
jgi:hypothetical protein